MPLELTLILFVIASITPFVFLYWFMNYTRSGHALNRAGQRVEGFFENSPVGRLLALGFYTAIITLFGLWGYYDYLRRDSFWDSTFLLVVLAVSFTLLLNGGFRLMGSLLRQRWREPRSPE